MNFLYLNDNSLKGTIPPEIGDIKYLSILHLQDNKLEGGVPNEFGKLIDLTQLMLQRNDLDTSFIPYSIHEIDALQAIY